MRLSVFTWYSTCDWEHLKLDNTTRQYEIVNYFTQVDEGRRTGLEGGGRGRRGVGNLTKMVLVRSRNE